MRTERLNIRVTAEEHELLRRAAEANGQTITQYVLSRVVADAHDDLADRTSFAVGGPAWTEFRARLDRPSDFNPALDKLLTKQSPWQPDDADPAAAETPLTAQLRLVTEQLETLLIALAGEQLPDRASGRRRRSADAQK